MNRYQRLSIHAVIAAMASVGLAGAALQATAAEWGSIKGKFTFEGKDDAKPIPPTKDPAVCGKHEIPDERIVADDKGALQNVFVYLVVARGKTVEIHDDYKSGEKKAKVLDNKGCRFEPHAMTLWTEEPLEIRNSDGIGHNTNAQQLVVRENVKFNESVPTGAPLTKKFAKSEPIPSQFSCSIHPWMNAYVLIRENPYMAVSAADGSFEIKNVPAGDQEFVFWHEAKGNLRDLKVGKEKCDRKGQVEIKIPAGETIDLGEIKVPASLLGK